MPVDQIKQRHPPLDPELETLLRGAPELSASLLPRHLVKIRALHDLEPIRTPDDVLHRGGAIAVEEITIPSSTPGVNLDILLLRPANRTAPSPGLCFLHGGGMVAGDPRTGVATVLDWIEILGFTVASVGYRLAPENPHPIPVEDSYAALVWIDANRARLGMDDAPLSLAGASAGGGLAAGAALLARERGGPPLADLIMISPMIDDRGLFPSSTELEGEGIWDSRSNRTGWEALLGAAVGGPNVPSCAAASREGNLANLPATFLDVGAVETFRDEVIDFGARLAQAGVSTELHVWGGAFHGFDLIAANSAVSKSACATRIDYLRRRLRARPQL